MATDEKCFICEESILSQDAVVVKQRGIETLIKSSKARKDNKHLQLGVPSVKVHISCRKNYPRSDSIKAALRPIVSATQVETENRGESLRSSLICFDFREKCLYCSEDIDDEFFKRERKKEVDKRRKVYSVRSIPMRDKILQAAEKRSDKWGDEVKNRITNTIDLVAADAMYHQSCFVLFFSKVPKSKKRGRPEVEEITLAMEEMYTFHESMDDSQVSLADLMSQCTGYVPVEATVKTKLKNKYGDSILITQNQNQIPTICFRDTGLRILSDAWYSERKMDERGDRLRIVQAAAAIIRQDIQSQVHDNTSYPPSDEFLKNASGDIPETLDVFLRNLMSKKKTTIAGDISRKLISIGHAIISIIRPRSFLSCVQTSLAVFLYRKFGSKNLITLLSNLGVCASYKDAQVFEASAIYHPQPPQPPQLLTQKPGSFCQFVFDNADFNVCTIDGLNTFHSMGGIKCVTPATSVTNDTKIVRMSNIPRAEEIGQFGAIPIATFESGNGIGLKSLFIEDLNGLNPLTEDLPLPQPSDILWMCRKWLQVPRIPGWKGFMHSVTQDLPRQMSKIVPIPFVNSPPSNYDTIFTVLKLAVEESVKLGQSTCFVTFDQPLYVKARDIVAASSTDPLMSKISVQVRLGGFHLLMSFLGCIGYIMAGSGLKELLSAIYAPTSVEKMLSGHAYARAVRAHLLAQMALAKIILDSLQFTDTEREEIKDMLSDFFVNPLPLQSINENALIKETHEKMKEKLCELKRNGATSALWIQYFHMVTLMKQFIHAERSGDWSSHLRCIQRMIPFFHASGHLLYAKASQLYLQDMLKLQATMEKEEYEKFITKGYFTIRRTDAF